MLGCGDYGLWSFEFRLWIQGVKCKVSSVVSSCQEGMTCRSFWGSKALIEARDDFVS